MKLFIEKSFKLSFQPIFIFLAILLSISLFFDLYLAKKKQVEVPETVRVMDFPVRQKEFGGNFLKTIVYVGQGNYTHASQYMKKMSSEWQYIEEDFNDAKPRNFRRINNWPQRLSEINLDIDRAIEAQADERMAESFAFLKSALIKIELLLEEAELRNIDIELASFYVLMKEVVSLNERNEAIKMMPELKMRFTKIKELDLDNKEFQLYLAKIGDAMARIEMSTPKIFNEFKEDLEPAFMSSF